MKEKVECKTLKRLVGTSHYNIIDDLTTGMEQILHIFIHTDENDRDRLKQLIENTVDELERLHSEIEFEENDDYWEEYREEYGETEEYLRYYNQIKKRHIGL